MNCRTAGGLAAYFRAYPTVKFINKTIITPQKIQSSVMLITEKPNIETISAIGKHLHFNGYVRLFFSILTIYKCILRQKSGAGHLFADYCEILPESTSAIQLYRLSELHWAFQSARSRRRSGSVRRSGRCEVLRIGIAISMHIICAEMW